MKTVRTGLTQNDVVINMLELAGYLAEQEEGVNTIDIDIENVHFHFEAYTSEVDK